MHTGESPAECAQREIREEAGIEVSIDRLHLVGLISERAFEGKGHWLLFYYRVLGPVDVPSKAIPEGTLEWFRPEEIETLPLPETDRQIIWPLIRAHEAANPDRPGFFALHIDCSTIEPDGRPSMTWSVQQPTRSPPSGSRPCHEPTPPADPAPARARRAGWRRTGPIGSISGPHRPIRTG